MTSEMQEFLRLRNRIVGGQATERERERFALLAGRLEHEPSSGLLLALVDDSSEDVSYNALCALVLRMGIKSREVSDACWRHFENDDRDDVRRMALACLSSIYFGSHDLSFFDRLEALLRSPETPSDLLETAYEALFQLVGLPPTEWPNRRSSRELMVPEDIDWMKVAQLRAQVEAEQKRRGGDDGRVS